MCDPASLFLASSVASAGMGAVSSLQAGKAEDAAAKSNASAARAQGQLAVQKGVFDAEESKKRFEKNKGVVESRIATSGIDAASFYDILSDDAAEAALEQSAIRTGAKNNQNTQEFNARNMEAQGKAAKSASYMKAGASVIGAVGSYASGGGFKSGSGVNFGDAFSFIR